MDAWQKPTGKVEKHLFFHVLVEFDPPRETRCGFGTAETLRRNFVRRLGISPDHYRKTFA